jgi:hypothetical protein
MKLFIMVLIVIVLVFLLAILVDFFFNAECMAGTNFNVKMIPPILLNGKALVKWHPSADTHGYKIFAFVAGGSKKLCFVTSDTSIVAPCDSLLTYGIERVYFYVKAFNEAGDSAPSDTVSIPLSKTRVLFGDANGDSVVNVLDSAIFWRTGMLGLRKGMPGYNSAWDVDGNGMIDALDHIYFINNIGQSTKK